MTSVVYKIRRKTDGLYSKGGTYPTFSKTGKTWNTRGALSNHFALLNDPYYRRMDRSRIYEDCEIVVIEVVPTEVNTMPVSAWTKVQR